MTGMATEVLGPHLDDLAKREVLVLDVDPLSAERGQYRFIQGVVREVAYQSLAKRDRRAKHLAAARYFESLGEDELAGVLASHYLAAYRASPSGDEADALAAQARVALRAAADRATALHAPHGALEYLEQALEVTIDPSEQAALHERAAAAASSGGRLGLADDHARQAVELYAAHGDRLGVLRGRTAQAGVRLIEHGDVVAGEILRAALADVGDLPTAPEIVAAQSEIARVLMLQGSPESLAWCDRVLANPAEATPSVLVGTLITKGSALTMVGRLAESEAILRGAVILADRLGEPHHMLRARNNLGPLLEEQKSGAMTELGAEVFDIAQRFGERTWIHQAIGIALTASLETGHWEDWMEQAATETPDATGFYRFWFEAERGRRLAYRGQSDTAQQILEAAVADPSIQNSGQAMAYMAMFQAEIRLAQGRWADALAVARSAWSVPDSKRRITQLAMFAATAAGDAEGLADAMKVSATLPAELLLSQADRHGGAVFAALLAGRWDDARLSYLNARRLLEDVGARTVLARLQLTVGHLASDHFPEAAEASRAAEDYFHDRGADAYVATYRANVNRPEAPRDRTARATATDALEADSRAR
jgi:tetratricopeptide (TPR) repeat protein